MSFEEMKELLGFLEAVRVFENQIPEEVWESFSAEQLTDIYEKAFLGSSLRKKAKSELLKTIESRADFKECLRLYKRLPSSDPELPNCALENVMKKTTNSFEEWLEINKISCHLANEIEDVVLSNIKKTVKTFQGWERVYKEAHSYSKMQDTAFSEMVKLADSFGEWLLIYGYSSYNSEIRSVALSKMIKLARNFKEWSAVHRKTRTDSESEKEAFSKMIEKATSFQDWFVINRTFYTNENLKKIALSKMQELTTSFQQCVEIYNDSSIKDSELRNSLLPRMKKLAPALDW